MYAEFDAAHKEDHAHTVIDQSMRLLDSMQQWIQNQDDVDEQWLVPVDRELLKMAAACHDLGLVNGGINWHQSSLASLARTGREVNCISVSFHSNMYLLYVHIS